MCECGHTRSSHAYGPPCVRNLCACLSFRLKKADLVCTCGCPKGAHMGKPQGCIPHGFHEHEVPQEPRPERLSLTTVCACSHVNNWHVRADHNDTHCAASDCPCGAFRASSEAEEPPLTPEEEEAIAAKFEAADAEHLPPPEGPEYTPCVCGHIEPEHDETGECWDDACDCVAYRTKSDEPPPPQPERRPPYAVAYSVSGHLFEVALSGDATVRAVDGALVIQHHLGPVAGIVSVLPVINKES